MKFSRLLILGLGLTLFEHSTSPITDLKKFDSYLKNAGSVPQFVNALNEIDITDPNVETQLQAVEKQLQPPTTGGMRSMVQPIVNQFRELAKIDPTNPNARILVDAIDKKSRTIRSSDQRLVRLIAQKAAQKREQIARSRVIEPVIPADIERSIEYQRIRAITQENIIDVPRDELDDLLNELNDVRKKLRNENIEIPADLDRIEQTIKNQIATPVALPSGRSKIEEDIDYIALYFSIPPRKVIDISSDELQELLTAYNRLEKRVKARTFTVSQIPDIIQKLKTNIDAEIQRRQKRRPGQKQDISIMQEYKAFAAVMAAGDLANNYDAVIKTYERLQAATKSPAFEQFTGTIPEAFTNYYHQAQAIEAAQKIPKLDITQFIDQKAVTDFGDALLQFVSDIKKIVDDNHLYQGILRNLYGNLNILSIINNAQIPGIPKIQLSTGALTGTRNEALEKFVNSAEIKNLGSKLTDFVTKISGQTSKENLQTLLINLKLFDITSTLFPEIKTGNKNPGPLRRMNRR